MEQGNGDERWFGLPGNEITGEKMFEK